MSPAPGTIRAAALTPGWASRNWSGYAVTSGAPFTSVSGTFVVPTVLPPAKKRQMHKLMISSDWVGIDGFSSGDSTVIQAGVEELWTGGRTPGAFYQAWWELYPQTYENPIGNVAVGPGTTITVTISEVLPGSWMISLTNDDTGQTFLTEQNYSGQGGSAEWIHEAVTYGRHIATLPRETNVTFYGARANSGGVGFSTSEAGVMMKGRHVISTPSVPDASGNGFSVGYGSAVPAPPSM